MVRSRTSGGDRAAVAKSLSSWSTTRSCWAAVAQIIRSTADNARWAPCRSRRYCADSIHRHIPLGIAASGYSASNMPDICSCSSMVRAERARVGFTAHALSLPAHLAGVFGGSSVLGAGAVRVREERPDLRRVGVKPAERPPGDFKKVAGPLRDLRGLYGRSSHVSIPTRPG